MSNKATSVWLDAYELEFFKATINDINDPVRRDSLRRRLDDAQQSVLDAGDGVKEGREAVLTAQETEEVLREARRFKAKQQDHVQPYDWKDEVLVEERKPTRKVTLAHKWVFGPTYWIDGYFHGHFFTAHFDDEHVAREFVAHLLQDPWCARKAVRSARHGSQGNTTFFIAS